MENIIDCFITGKEDCVAHARVREHSSVTRFGEILKLWQNFTSLCLFFASSFSIWQNIKLTLIIQTKWSERAKRGRKNGV